MIQMISYIAMTLSIMLAFYLKFFGKSTKTTNIVGVIAVISCLVHAGILFFK